MERETSINPVNFGVTRFSEDIQTVRMVDRSGQPDERNSSICTDLGLYLKSSRQTILRRNIAKKSVITNSHAAHAEEERTRTIVATEIGIS